MDVDVHDGADVAVGAPRADVAVGAPCAGVAVGGPLADLTGDGPTVILPAMVDDASFFLDGLSTAEGTTDEAPPLPADTEHFHFVRELGRGGMGVVYEAVEVESNRRVALKVITPRAPGDATAASRFEQEARTAAKISHAHCVFVYGYHVVHGKPAIAMELIDGRTLEDHVNSQGTPDIATAVRWILDLLDGLEAAHEAGIVHRDIKPSNVFLTTDGRIKLGDFGLSRSIDFDSRLTQTGAFLGSPLYASPEQVRGRDVDARSDLYSVGATLYAVVTGGSPWRASSIGDLFTQIATEPPIRPRRLQPTIPRGLEKVILRALEKEPSRRYRNCDEFRDALSPWAPGSVTPAKLSLRFAAWMVDRFVVVTVYGLLIFALVTSGPALPAWAVEAMVQWLDEALLLVYWSAIEGRFGRALGKRIFGLSVVRGHGQPGTARAALRAAILLVAFHLDELPIGWLARVTSVLPLVLLVTMRRANGYRCLQDLLSGTRVVATATPMVRLLRRRPVLETPVEASAALPATLDAFTIMGRLPRVAGGKLLVGRDQRLERDVWLLESAAPTATDAVADAGAFGVRMLESLRTEDKRYEIYEALGGSSFERVAARSLGLGWVRARAALLTLTGALAAGADVRLDRLWIDRQGRLRLLPFSSGESDARSLPAGELITRVARGLLGLSAQGQRELPTDMPEEARVLLERVVDERSATPEPRWLHQELLATDSHPRSVSSAIRAIQIVVAAISALTLLGFGDAIFGLDDGGALTIGSLKSDGGLQASATLSQPRGFYLRGLLTITLGGLLPSCILAFAMRGSLTFSIFGIRVVDRLGHRVSRKRAALRAAVAWSPTTALVGASWLLAHFGHGDYSLVSSVAAFVVPLVIGLHAIVRPNAGAVDLACGTRLVR